MKRRECLSRGEWAWCASVVSSPGGAWWEFPSDCPFFGERGERLSGGVRVEGSVGGLRRVKGACNVTQGSGREKAPGKCPVVPGSTFKGLLSLWSVKCDHSAW